MITKKQVLKAYGGTVPEVAINLGMSQQRIHGWSDVLTKLHVDGIIAGLVRQQIRMGKKDNFHVDSWLFK